MKKGFGIFFLVLGSANMLISFIGIMKGYGQAVFQFIFAIGIFILGLWMYNSSNNKKQ